MSSTSIYTHQISNEAITPKKIKNSYKMHEGYDFIPYVYLLKCKPTGMVYYGSRFAACAHPDFFLIDYFTSSKIVHEMILSYGIQNFEYQIRKTFKTSEECQKWEQKVLRRISVSLHEKFINIDDCQQMNNNSNTTFITNEITGICIRIKKGMPIPTGWMTGNKNKITSVDNRRWFYDPETMKSHHIDPVEKEITWKEGRGDDYTSNSKSLTGKMMWITNGKHNLSVPILSDIPIDWYRGRTKSEGERKNSNESNTNRKGNIKINDGMITKEHNPLLPIPIGWVKGQCKIEKDRTRFLIEFVNKHTGEHIQSESNPDKNIYMTLNRYNVYYRRLLEENERWCRYYNPSNNTVVYLKKSESVPDNTIMEFVGKSKEKSKSITINNGKDIICDHPKDIAIPTGWKEGNYKLIGRSPSNKKEDRSFNEKTYENIFTGEILIAECNPNKIFWHVHNKSKFTENNISPLNGRKAYIDIVTGKKKYFKSDDVIPENFIPSSKKS
jgi:hypothetical protein